MRQGKGASTMVNERVKKSEAENLRQNRTYGKVRCHNPSCMERLVPAPGEKVVQCPTCGMAYRLVWVTPELPRIRGPVWEVNRKLAEAAINPKRESPNGA